MKHKCTAQICLSLLLLATTYVRAADVGKLTGVVTDAATGDPIPSVNISVVGSSAGASTDIDGAYFILNLPVGTVDLKVTSLGYETQNIREIEINADRTTELNVALKEAVLQGQEVTIVAKVDVVRRDQPSTLKTIPTAELQALPIATYQDVIAVTAGAVGSEDNLHIRGGRRDEILYLVDGLPVKDPQFQRRSLDLPRHAVKELQVLTAGYSAEYGEAQSAVINLSVKEGSQAYTGKFEHLSDFSGLDHYQDYDRTVASVSGPEPITKEILPKLGATVPGNLYFFGSMSMTSRNTNDNGVWIDSDRWYRHPVAEWTGWDIRKNQANSSSNLKLTYYPTSKLKFTGGWNQAQRWENPFWYRLSKTFPDDFSVEEQIIGIHALSGLVPLQSDARSFDNLFYLDDDQDGRVDEEALNGADDDGDGLVDEDLQYYRFNANNSTRTDRIRDQLYYSTFTHSLNAKSFYTIRLGVYHAQRTIAGGNKASNEYGVASEPYIDLPDAEGKRNNRYDIGEPFTDQDNDGMYDYGNPANQYPDVYGFHIAGDGLAGNFQQLVPDWAQFESFTYTLRTEYSNQVSKSHLLKSGLEYDYRNVASEDRPYSSVSDPQGIYTDVYRYYPNAAALYGQDKMEFRDLTVNAGLRVDYFHIPGDVLQNREYDENGANRGYYYYDKPPSSGRTYWSPRLGIAYSVTDRDVFHFNYGYFYQRGRDDYYFTAVNQLQTGGTPIQGNPGLEPQKTIAYELGVRHQFGIDFLLDVGAYYKDIDDLIQSGSVNKQRFEEGLPLFIGENASQYYNIDYASVRGFEFNVSKSYASSFSGRLTYALAWASARNSYDRGSDEARDPSFVRSAKENPVGWDRRHQIIFNLGWNSPLQGKPWSKSWLRSGWQMNLISQALSGLPYTPTAEKGGEEIPGQEFTRRSPWTYVTDVNFARAFGFGGLHWKLIAEIRNLFDRANVLGWDANQYTIDTSLDGRPGYVNDTTSPNYGYEPKAGPNPDAYSERRLVRAGLSVEF